MSKLLVRQSVFSKKSNVFDLPLKTIYPLFMCVSFCLSFMCACPYLLLFVHPSLHAILVFVLSSMLTCDSMAVVCKLFVMVSYRFSFSKHKQLHLLNKYMYDHLTTIYNSFSLLKNNKISIFLTIWIDFISCESYQMRENQIFTQHSGHSFKTHISLSLTTVVRTLTSPKLPLTQIQPFSSTSYHKFTHTFLFLPQFSSKTTNNQTGPKLNTKRATTKRKAHRPTPPIEEPVGILVQDLLEEANYDRYIEKFQSEKHVAPQFYSSLSDVESTGFRLSWVASISKIR